MDNYFLYSVCFVAGGAGALIISKLAFKWGLIDRPNGRSSHATLTPKGGGIGILLVFIISSFILNIPSTFWFPATFMAIFSLIGDKVEIFPIIRLPIQFIAAIIVVFPLLFFSSFFDL